MAAPTNGRRLSGGIAAEPLIFYADFFPVTGLSGISYPFILWNLMRG